MVVAAAPVRVFISYAHDDAAHEERVRDFWLLLRKLGIDARLDLTAAEQRVDWAQWMTEQVRDADHVLVVASPDYKRRAEGDAEPGEGRGVQWEARLIRELFYRDQKAGLQRVLPVVLPGGSPDDLPLWLGPASTMHYEIKEYTKAGVDALLRLLTGQPWEIEPPVGDVPTLPSRAAATRGVAAARPALRTEVMIEAAVPDEGVLASAVWVAGSLLCRQQRPLPAEVVSAWSALRLPARAGGQRLAEAGPRLASALLGADDQRLLAGLVNRVRPGDSVDVVLLADGAALALPVELIRLSAGTSAGTDGEAGPLGLMPGVSVSRRPTAGGTPGDALPTVAASGAGPAGPLKVLAAVAAPDETKTTNRPLDSEAEMQAVLDAVTSITDPHAQIRILEVASLPAIREALAQDSYHALHLSAHGSADMVELEDEDGAPTQVTPQALMAALVHAGRPVPLIVLSSCSGGSAGESAMAAGLIGHGADRVIAMLAPVTERYATTLARHLYRELSTNPSLTVGLALARARYLAEEDRARLANDHLPAEYGIATVFAEGGDGPLVDPAAEEVPLRVVTTPPSGKLVRDLRMGALIGRRSQLRDAMGVLRRTDTAIRRFGVANGVVLTGVGGIGKTAIAGRVTSRLRDDGWMIAVHEGRWNPTALIGAAARTLDEALVRARRPDQSAVLRDALDRLTDPASDDGPKLAAIAELLAMGRMLLVFDDFEQNLTSGGDAFLDPALDEIITGLADAADSGALLFTCRYPLPGTDRLLVQIGVPPLSPAELRRMFLRLPALADLDVEDRRLLIRTVGGHPRLIEFTDALLRGGHASLKHVQTKLRALARAEGVDLDRDPGLTDVLDQAMLLGSADILLTELTGLLTTREVLLLHQVAVGRAPMTLDDLAFAISWSQETSTDQGTPGELGSPPKLAELRSDVRRLADLTLFTSDEDISMHPWTAELVARNAGDLDAEHQRALAMRLRRFEQRRGSYGDLIDIPRHLAALHRYDDIPGVATQATRALDGTLATAAYLAEIRPLIPLEERAAILVGELEFQALLDMGDLSSAIRQMQAIHRQVQARAATDPANAQWQRDLSVSYNKLGDMDVAAGDLTGARTNYQASLDVMARLADTDPANTEWQRDLSVSHERLGSLAVAAGDLDTARTNYQTALDIRTRLTDADPGNTQSQRDLSVSHNNLGDIAMATGALTTARTHYQIALDLIARLTDAEPANTLWQRDLSVSHTKLGDIAAAAGEPDTARTNYQTALDIAARLTDADPANTQWQRDLSVNHNKLGDIAAAAGDFTTARTNFQTALDIIARLTDADPANSQWQRDLSVSHNKLGDIAAAAGDLTTALTNYQTALYIAARLAAADPANTLWQRDLSVSHDKLGDISAAARDQETARTNYQAGLDITARLAAADPANTEWQRDLSISHNKLGDIAAAAADLDTARTNYQAGLDVATHLAGADAANTQWQRDLSISHNKLGDIAAAAADPETARTNYQEALDIRTRLTEANPANTEWQRDLSVSYNKLATIAAAAGDLDTARANYQASLDIMTRLTAADPGNSQWQRDLSFTRQRIDELSNPPA